MNFENVILQNLIGNEDYGRKVLPFLKKEYFDRNYGILFELISNYAGQYNSFPSKNVLLIELKNKNDISEDSFKECRQIVETLTAPEAAQQLQWAIDETEAFCQNKAIYNAILDSIKIMDDKSGKLSKGSIPQLLSDALGVSFDSTIGHDFLHDMEHRFDYYTTKEDKIPFDIELLNVITAGGFSRKTLNVFLGGTGAGKSLVMCHLAAANLLQGRNVLYITLEMAEEKIAERIDANLLKVTLKELRNLPRDMYLKKIDRVKQKTPGRLIIKEYPTSSAGSAHFRHLLNELKIKKNFVPDIIYIDYINICCSSRLKSNFNVNSYTMIKTIAEELRGLAVENNVPIVSATQTNRGGYDNSDVSITDTSESFGLPATVDFMAALIVNEGLEKLNQMMIKQLKNRYGDPAYLRKFVIGVDKARMTLYNTDDSAQDDICDEPYDPETGEIFDKNKFRGFL